MVSVVIPAYNNALEVDRLLGSIAERCRGSTPFEVIVVDDGSADNAISAACARHPFARCLRLQANQGAAAARNAGVAQTQHELLVMFDADMVLISDVIGLASRMFEDPAVDAAVGAVSPVPMNGGLFQRFWGLVKAFSLPQGPYSSTFYPMVGAIRKRIFQDVGGFNEHIKGASIEDYEFSLRLSARGYRVRYNPALLVRTHYKDLLASLSQSFSRAAQWTVLFSHRKRFDNHTTTAAQAVCVLAGAGLIGSVVLLALGLGSGVLTAGLLGLYACLNSRFLRYVASTSGPWFVPPALCFHVVLSLVVTLGVAAGGLQLLRGTKRAQAVLYG